MPPYEVTRIVRSAGFDPLAPPRREGTTYVLRATDFRGILMRVVVDARSGAIRAVNRIVPPNYPGPIGMMPYGAPAYGVQPYGPPPYGRPPYGALPPDGQPNVGGQEIAPSEGIAASSAPLTTSLPLPRPRPPQLAARRQGNISSAGASSAPAIAPAAKGGDAKSGIAAPAAPAAPKKPVPDPIND
jgi:hypothetical protein